MPKAVKPDASAVRYVEIDDSRAGQRLDNFLIATLKGVPRSHIYRILRKGEVRINRGRVKPDYRLEPGDMVRIPPLRLSAPSDIDPAQTAEKFAWLQQRILYEDDDLMVVNKPSGLPVHSGSGVNIGLIEALRHVRAQDASLELAHRLDRETSGCLVVTKTRPAMLAMHRLLRHGGIEKHYLALVQGAWRGGAREINVALEKNRPNANEHMVEVSDDGKEAISVFIPHQRLRIATLMEIKLLTGRTHQARVHAAHLGHPIAGDDKYGDREFNRRLHRLGLRRLFLHAQRLTFAHPQSGSKIDIEAPLPDELSLLLERLSHES
ncbi:MAG: RluA family pseudouridine synthase [Gammaproteobacteria bacterium]|nr:RluA family pseudouridine synthase [Gammaproteobacteria bacterium]